jgi:general secretion pathway protein G
LAISPGSAGCSAAIRTIVSKSELVLSITPRIVRNLPYQAPSDMEFDSGTETSMRMNPVNPDMAPMTVEIDRKSSAAGCRTCRSREALIMNGQSRSRGFTLIEMVVTLAIVGLLASIAAPLTETVIRRGKEQELRTALYQIRDAVDAYKRAADAGRIEKSVASNGYPANLKVLVEGVRDLRSPKGAKIFFLRRIPRVIRCWAKASATPKTNGACVPTTARLNNPRDGEDVFDVYSKARGKGLNGIAYSEW